jgi:hypothetical protein
MGQASVPRSLCQKTHYESAAFVRQQYRSKSQSKESSGTALYAPLDRQFRIYSKARRIASSVRLDARKRTSDDYSHDDDGKKTWTKPIQVLQLPRNLAFEGR